MISLSSDQRSGSGGGGDEEKAQPEPGVLRRTSSSVSVSAGQIHTQAAPEQQVHSALQRGLTGRHIQLFSIGGVIGTGLFLATGSGLAVAGPLSLLLAFALYSAIIWGVAQGVGEISTLIPVGDAYLMWATRFGGRAYAGAVSWNYIYTELTIAAAEITAVSGCMAYWVPDINPAAWVSVVLALYVALNIFPVRYYGEFEFWFSLVKVLLIVGLILMTVVLMSGGNPYHDAFGFAYWQNPGPLNTQYTTGALGRFAGFWSSLRVAGFTVGGPHFIAMAAPETINPRRNVPKVIGRVIWRIVLFYILGVLCLGVLVPYNDPLLLDALANGHGVAYSPFVVGMVKHGLAHTPLPSIVNFCVLTSAASCGNASVFNACRGLRTMATQGLAPSFFARTTSSGVPLFNLAFVVALCCLAYMTAAQGSSVVFAWFTNLAAVGLMTNYAFIMVSWLLWSRALRVQGFHRDRLPFRGVATPVVIPVALGFMCLVILTNGYGVFVDGQWDVQAFLVAYFGVIFPAFVFVVYCIFNKGAKWVDPHTADIFAGVAEADDDEAYWKVNFVAPKTAWQKFMDWLL